MSSITSNLCHCLSFVVSLCLFLSNLGAEGDQQSFIFAIEENTQAGTKVGQFPAEDLQGGQLTYQLLPDLPAGLIPRMWLDASGLSVAEKRWEDKSGTGNHASMQGSAQGYPVVVRDVQNGHSVMRYFGIGDAYHSFNEISDIRTAFWVIAKEPSNWGMLLGHNYFYDFHLGPNNTFFHQQYASGHTLGGDIFISGNKVEPNNATFPSSLSIVSLRSSGNLKANNFCKDRQFSWHSFHGDLGELIIFNTPLGDNQIKQVETYLHHKWNLPLGYEPVLPPIVVSADGVVSSTQAFDYETLSHYRMRVRAMDESGFSIIREVAVSVTDVVEDLDKDGVQDPYDPDIDGDGVSNADEIRYGTNPLDPNSLNRPPTNLRVENELAVLENRAVGTVVGRLLADDADGDELTYSVAGQSFTIEQNGTIRTARLFDHEASASVAITFTVTDPRGGSASASFSVSIDDLPNDLDEDGITNESDPDRDGDGMSNSQELANFSDPDDPSSINHAPVDLNSTTELTIVENRPAATPVGQFVAYDEDTGSNLSFSFSTGEGDTDNSLFTIDSSGILRTVGLFDYENNASSYSVRIRVADEWNASMESSFSIRLIDEDSFSPLSLDTNLMLWLDAADRATLDLGTYLGELGPPEDGNATFFWSDKSGYHHHALKDGGSPTYESTGLNAMPSINTNGGRFVISDSNESFDQWNKMSVIMVYHWTKLAHWNKAIWKNGDWSEGSFVITGMNTSHRNQGTGSFFGLGGSTKRLNGGTQTYAWETPVIFSLVYDGTAGTNQIHGNGDLGGSSTGNPEQLRGNPTYPVKFGDHNRFAEIMIFNDALGDAARQQIEGYLAHKWAMTHLLPDSHPFKNAGMMDGTIALAEELPAGAAMLHLSDIDPDYNASWSYSLTEANDSNDNELFSVFDPGTFDPASLNNLALWLDAADSSTITADSDGNVSVWVDKSGNANHAIQNIISEQPTYLNDGMGGYPCLDFENNKLSTAEVDMINKCLIAVIQPDSITSDMQIFSHSSLNVQIRINADGTLKYAGNPPLYSNTTGSSIGKLDANQLVMVSFIFNDKLEFSINGHWEQTTAVMTLGGNSVYNQIGTVSSSTNRFNGKMGELIILDSRQATDRQNVEAYLAYKWGLADHLPAVHSGRKDVLLTATSLDYETNASTYQVRVQATANGAVQNDKEYKILLSNVFEDLDGDGIEDYYDLDDDGDGFFDLVELAYPSDPRDPHSHANVAPNELNASGSLTVSEDATVGTLVTRLSASDPDGDQNLTYRIAQSVEQLGPQLWLDANHPSAGSAVWEDQSIYRRDAIRYHSPTVVENVQNGLSVMRYETNETTPDYHEWDSINNIRTVVAVLKRDSGSILTNSGGYHFWSSTTKILHFGNAHAYLRQGISRLNGLEIDATVTDTPNSQFFLLSFVPTGNVSASRIGRDRSQTNSNYHFDGDYGELLLFNQPLEGLDLFSVEQYLAHKWGLMGSLDSTHPYKEANHTSVREHLSIEENGTLRIARPLDYEADANYSILASVTDSYGYSYYNSFNLTVGDVFEDLDGDNIADHLDVDIDGDGLSNADEKIGYSDPWDENSTNRPPSSLEVSNLSFSENLAPGSIIGEFNATDPDGDQNLTFTLGAKLPDALNLALWLDASDISTITDANGSVSQWADKSGKGMDARQVLVASQPSLSSGYHETTIEFDGNSDYLTVSDLRISQPLSLFVVLKKTGGTGSDYRVISGTDDKNRCILAFNSSGLVRLWSDTWADSKFTIPHGFVSISAIFNDSNSQVGLNGSLSEKINPGNQDLLNGIQIGAQFNGIGNYFGGQIGEIIVLNHASLNSERQKIEGYLAHKWGLVDALPPSHSAKEDAVFLPSSSANFFTLDKNGTFSTNRGFNYETDDHNYSLTVRAVDDYGAYLEQNLTFHLTNVLEDENRDGAEDYDGNQSLKPIDITVVGNALRVSENAELGTVVGQVRAIDPDGDVHHKYAFSTLADAGRLHPLSVSGLTAWFDASDGRTVQKVEGTNKLKAWSNKVDHEVHLSPYLGREPDANGSINGLSAVEFTAVDQISKKLWGYRKGANWNPMGENGAPSGKLTDGSLYMTFRPNKSTRSRFPFNFGWSDHFPWENNRLYWRFSDRRRDVHTFADGVELMLGFEFSVSKGTQRLLKNGRVLMSGPRTSATNLGGPFFFPSDYGPDDIPEWTVGEMLVVRGVVSEEDHLRIEGYLAHKWGLGNSLPEHHLFSKSYQHFAHSDVFWSIDPNGTIRTATTFDHEVDSNLSITVLATGYDGLSLEKNFTIEISNVVEADLDGDGIEDLLDDDWDGDGVTNLVETKMNTNPRDPNSRNLPPTGVTASNLSLSENAAVGTVVGKFSVTDPDGAGDFRYSLNEVNLNNQDLGWYVSQLNGDSDSGISSSAHYTCAVNVNGAGRIINGVAFSGESGTSGQGWRISQGFHSTNASRSTSVSGDVAGLLNNGFRYAGNPQQIILTGLTPGMRYVFALYSQAWGTSGRIVELSSSATEEKVIVEQDKYGSVSPDGLLVECSYVANSTDVEFTFSPTTDSSWHLYGFSNRVASINENFSIDDQGNLITKKVFDYETDDTFYPIDVWVMDDHNSSIHKSFTISLTDIIEDLDGDGVQDAHDEDWDGDKVSNEDELKYGSDPRDKNSVNQAPTSLTTDKPLVIAENQPAGTVVGRLIGTDPQGGDTLRYSMLPLYPKSIKPMVWLDAVDEESQEVDSTGNLVHWRNKASRIYDFIQASEQARPNKAGPKLNGYPTIGFDGNDYMHSEGVLPVGGNFTILMVAGLEKIESVSDGLFSLGSQVPEPSFHFRSLEPDGFWGRYSNNDMGENRTFYPRSVMEPILHELFFDLDNQFVRSRLNGENMGKRDYFTAPGQNHTFRIFTDLSLEHQPKGYIGEVLIYDEALGGGQRRMVETYLGEKWNLPMSEPISTYLFAMSEDGVIRTTEELDFEKDANYTITARVTDDRNITLEQNFVIQLDNVVEDADGDGVEDFYDPDDDNDGIVDELDPDIDGDGISNLVEMENGTDPLNPNSTIHRPVVDTFVAVTDEKGNDLLKGKVLADGYGKIEDFGMVLSSSISLSSNNQTFWIRAKGTPEQFYLLLSESPIRGTLYYRAWARNAAGYGTGPVKKVFVPEPDQAWWGKSQELPGGWRRSEWFGMFQQDPSDWLYHEEMGWVYHSEAKDTSIWLWKKGRGWMWTKEGVWPYLWSNRKNNWLYFVRGRKGAPVFFDYTTRTYNQ